MKNKIVDPICEACGACDGTLCKSTHKELLHTYEYPEKFPQTYPGVRFTSDAMDCSLPISIDSHSGCSYSCTYCFANNLMRSPDRNPLLMQKIIKEGSFYSEWPLRRLESFLARDWKNDFSKAAYPLLDAGCPVQLGALGDPFDELERHSGWAKKAIPLFIKYKVPVRISTKGGLLLQKPEYLELFEPSPNQFWVAWSTISNSDELISKVDIRAPVTSERIKAVAALTRIGVRTSLRFRPFLPGVSDAYPGEPEAWRSLIYRFREAGAGAISFEYIFLNSAPTDKQKIMYRLMFRAMGNPKFGEQWNSLSNSKESCRRASRQYKYDMTRRIRDYCHELGMTFGCSDPHFKEWNDTGSCCGLPEEDEWFGNWSRRQMTNVIVEAHRAWERGERIRVSYLDWAPHWAHQTRMIDLIALRSWHDHRRFRNTSFGDVMRNKWNNPRHPRGPYNYFAGVLRPVGLDNGTKDLVYEYRNWHEKFDNEFKGE